MQRTRLDAVITSQQIIDHIMHMKSFDETYARAALAQYNALLPWMDLNAGVREAMKAAE